MKVIKYIGIPALLGFALGAIGGYLYYALVGCKSGTCPIWANPWFSTIWGALLGYLVGDMFKKRKKEA